jgi:transposase
MRARPRPQPVVYGGRSVEKMLGSLPVVAEYCRRLDLAGIIDRACPIRDLALLTHGQVIEALVANRLTSPAPLLRVEEWARGWAVEETLGVDPAALNDDRIGRALDAVAPELERIVGSVGAQAIAAFGIDVSRLHWDMTSISLYGAYAQTEDEFAAPRFGHPKDRRPDLKQVQAGLAVAGDGGVPVLHRAFDGGAGEVNQVVGAMTALTQMAGPRRFLLVGDSKLVSYGNIRDMIAAEVEFIAPASKTYVPARVLAELDLDVASEVDYVAERDQHKPASARGRWRVTEDTTNVGPGKKGRKTDPVFTLRRVFVHSTARAHAAASARAKKLDRATDDLDRLTRGLGSRHYPDEKAVTERVTAIGRTRRVTAYLRSQTGTDPATGKPTLTWSFDQTALDAETATDGWYALLTNLPSEITAAQVLTRYKGQEVVERRYSAFKGPLAVAPMFLKTNRRIEALITVICLALLIFCLIERAVRNALAPETRMSGLVPGQKAKPTGRLIMQALGGLRLIPAIAGQPALIPQPDPVQTQLLNLLAVDPTQPP